MIKYLQQLFAYNAWANDEVLASLQRASPPPARCMKLISHILAAETVWLERLQHAKQSVPVWPELTLEESRKRARQLAQSWKGYVGRMSEADLARTCDYTNTKGERWSSGTEDILMHVILHSAYHRGQIASDLRAAGFTPAYTDFIHAVRQQHLRIRS
jgi:uncharacterized damage-inducible protein DinB